MTASDNGPAAPAAVVLTHQFWSGALRSDPSVIGKTTVNSLQSGLVYGFAGQVDRIVEEIRGELGAEAPAIATGGLADLVVPHSRTIEKIDPWLTLEGLRLVWTLNPPTSA